MFATGAKTSRKSSNLKRRALQMVPFFGCGTVWSVWIGQKISSLIRDDKSHNVPAVEAAGAQQP